MEQLNTLEQQRLERIRKRVKALSGFYKHAMIYLVVNLALIAIKFFTLDPGEEFWDFGTFATAFFWGIGLAFHALGVFTENVFFGKDWEERKVREFMEKEKHQKWE